MGRQEGSKQKKTTDCTLSNPQSIHILDGDVVDNYTVDPRGYIHTNKRGWVGLKATVVLGKHTVKNDCITTDGKVFSCEIIAGGFISSLGKTYAGDEVTVIIHGAEV